MRNGQYTKKSIEFPSLYLELNRNLGVFYTDNMCLAQVGCKKLEILCIIKRKSE